MNLQTKKINFTEISDFFPDHRVRYSCMRWMYVISHAPPWMASIHPPENGWEHTVPAGTSIRFPNSRSPGGQFSPNRLPCRQQRGSQKPGIARRKGPRGDHSGPTRQQQHFRSKGCERDNDLLGQAFRVFFMGWSALALVFGGVVRCLALWSEKQAVSEKTICRQRMDADQLTILTLPHVVYRRHILRDFLN